MVLALILAAGSAYLPSSTLGRDMWGAQCLNRCTGSYVASCTMIPGCKGNFRLCIYQETGEARICPTITGSNPCQGESTLCKFEEVGLCPGGNNTY